MLPLALIFITALSTSPPPLETVAQIRRLSLEECRQARTVRIKGVVTYASGRAERDLFVQDESAGIYVLPDDRLVTFKSGDRVVVEGVTDPGDFAPCVRMTSIQKVSTGAAMPVPLPFTMMPEDARWLDGQFVQLWGLISKVECQEHCTVLTVYNTHGRVRVILPQPMKAESVKGIENASVTVRGVCVPAFDAGERIITRDPPRIFTNTFPIIPLQARKPEVGGSIGDLTKFSPDPHPGSRWISVDGVISGFSPSGAVYVQDQSGGLEVQLESPHQSLKSGQRVRATGLLSIEGRRIALNKAKIDAGEEGPIPQFVPIALNPLTAGFGFGMRIQTHGRVAELERRGSRTLMTLVDGSSRLELWLPRDGEWPPLQSRVQVTGVMGRRNFTVGGGTSLLIVDRPEAVSVLEAPPPVPGPPPPSWWTPQRIAVAVVAPLAIAFIAFAWVMTLRRQVRQKTMELRAQFESRAQLEEKLRTSQKLEAIGRLAGGIAHDFNNLLTVINGCSELLSADPSLSPMQIDLARDTRSAGERAAALVAQLLLFSRRQSVRLQAMDVRDSVREAERMLKRVIGENIRVECRIAPKLPKVRAEATLLHQIILNLAVNARDAMPGGGTLTITVSPSECGLTLSVTDTGHGMDEPTLGRIFEPFFTTKGVGAGTGLGLATVYGIIQTLEGEIHCQSKSGEGTTFAISLPADDAPAAEQDCSPRPSIRPGRGTILVCEDDDSVRDLACTMLSAAGYEVLRADTPGEAARLAETHPEPISLLLTDVVMPELNGLELAELVRPLRPAMKVVYMSGYSGDELLRRGIEEHAVPIVGKPFSAVNLTSKIGEVLNRSKSPADQPAAAG